jgi:hypothetical protein
MIIVPEKTVAFVPIILDEEGNSWNGDVSRFLKPLNQSHERDWFTPHFYKCLPLSIGNMQGFVFSVPFDFSIHWDGGYKRESLQFSFNKEEYDAGDITFGSEFGYGIATLHMPIVLKTPPGINLMTIAPPNFPLPGISPMTGVVETDNLRFTFTLNLKIDIPDSQINIKKDYPLVGILPIPRYFCDSFDLVSAYDIVDESLVKEEQLVIEENKILRDITNKKLRNNEGPYTTDKIYYRGKDIRGNKFKDHQLPRKKS